MLSLFSIVLATLLPVSTPVATDFAPVIVPVQSADEDFSARLDDLVVELEDRRVSGHIPGMALAIVKDDQVVLLHGFGVADVASQRRVDGDTIFAIGSTTKAFTTTLAGMLQDEGLLDFDDAVTEHLPYFELPIAGPDKDGDSTVTLRDLMCHRTGFTRMSTLWAGGKVAREDMLRTAVLAEPWTGFREEFYYNNVMFLAAGTAAGVAAGSSWDELIQTRIFDPLGMANATVSTSKAQENEDLALGYEWNEDTQSFDLKKMRDLVNIGPAGSINASATDMANWLRLQLARGEFAGERLISTAALEETWTPNMEISGSVDYGLGWMLREQNGVRVVEHGGNIDGFGAQVTLFPEQNLGYVLLTNVTMTPLQQESIGIVIDNLFTEPEANPVPAGDFDQYLGKFEANFGSFKNDTFQVLVQNDNLAVDVPGQMVYELHNPDEEGEWTFRITDTIAISFGRDASGSVTTLNMHQSGMTFELPREGLVVEAEIPLGELEKFLGAYYMEPIDEEVRILIQNNRLALNIPSQMVFELHAPDEDGKRNFRVSDEMALRFSEDESGAVTGFTMYEGDDTVEVLRVEQAPEEAEQLYDLEQLKTIRKGKGAAELLREHGAMRTTGTMRFAQSGITGTFELLERYEPAAFRFSLNLGDYGSTQLGFGDGSSWSFEEAVGYSELSGKFARQIARRSTTILDGDWSEHFDRVEINGVEELDGEEVLVVEVKYSDLPSATMFVDWVSGDLLEMKSTMVYGPMRMPVTSRFTDYRDFEGARVNYQTIEENSSTGRSIQTVEKIELGVELHADFHVWAEEK